jgi:formylglycine-generating enzyme required for sulfatase activity
MRGSLIGVMFNAFIFSCLAISQLTSGEEPPKEITNSIGMKLVLIPKGTFTMGSPASELGRYQNEVQHQVSISRDYYLGATEVTQAQYEELMGENPSYFQGERVDGGGARNPVELIFWDDAVEFCKRLSELPEEKKAGRIYRLPTEAEWEYACRAGSKTSYCFGEDTRLMEQYAWYSQNSNVQTHPVGEKKPNAWGLYDMHGNVWEWCSDRYGEYPKASVTDPLGYPQGYGRIFRGGCWSSSGLECRAAYRYWDFPSFRRDFFGFRVALSIPTTTK